MTNAPESLGSRLQGKDRRTVRRGRTDKLMVIVATLAALAAVAILVLMIGSVFVRGVGAINWDFFTKPTPQLAVGQSAGAGVANAIIGSLMIIGMATLVAVPFSLLVAIYTNEFASRNVQRIVRLALDMLNGIPSVVIGIFVFGLLVVGNGQKAYYAAFALAVIELPLIARSAQEVLALVPVTLRDASAALGAPRWKTIVKVVIPSSLGGVVTGMMLAIARVAGETAPIIFTSSLAANVISTDPNQALSTLPFSIFIYSESPDPHDHELAWAAALLLVLFVLVMSFLGRLFLARNMRKLEGRAGGSLPIGRYLGRLIEPMQRPIVRRPDKDDVGSRN